MEKVEGTASRPKKGLGLFGGILVALVGLTVVAIGICAVRHLVNRSRLEKSFSTITKTYPTLVFRRVKFSKYLVRGTLPSTDPHLSFLDVYLVRGTADIQFDLSEIELDKRRTNYLNRVLVLKYTGEKKFLVDMDISIDPGDITLAETIQSESFSKEDIDKAKKILAVPAGAIGAYVGSRAGSFAGSSVPFMKYSGGFSSLIGSAVGALAGAASGAGSAYLFTENLVTALQPTSGNRGSVMEMIAAAKPMIGMEIAGRERLLSASWEDETQQYYRKEFIVRLSTVAKSLGWKKVIVDFGGQK